MSIYGRNFEIQYSIKVGRISQGQNTGRDINAYKYFRQYINLLKGTIYAIERNIFCLLMKPKTINCRDK